MLLTIVQIKYVDKYFGWFHVKMTNFDSTKYSVVNSIKYLRYDYSSYSMNI